MKLTSALHRCLNLLAAPAVLLCAASSACAVPPAGTTSTMPLAPGLPTAAQAMTSATRTFLTSLSGEQRAQAVHAAEDPARMNWHYWPKEVRKGLPLFEMTPPQRVLAMEVLRASLSPEGFRKASLVMQLEEILRHFESDNRLRDPLRYYFTVFGNPDETGRWGLSVEGHHLSLNLLVENGRIASATPFFLGANPAEVRDNGGVGPPPGTRTLEREEELARRVLDSLTPEQRRRAVVDDTSPMDMQEGHRAQTRTTAPLGLSVHDMTAPQQEALDRFLDAVIGSLPADAARPRLEQLRREFDQTTFAWFGGTAPGAPSSCRVLGPSALILLYKTQTDPAGNPANHTHLLWRTPGRDFGAGAER